MQEAVLVARGRVRIIVLTKRSLLLLMVIFLLVLVFLGYFVSRVVPIVGDSLSTRRAHVVLDAGHGGVDGGAHDGQGVMEKDIVLDVVLRMRDFLVERGLIVELTRETDTDLSGFEQLRKGRHRADLQKRVELMNRGQVAVSVHVNAMQDSSAHGAVVMYAKGSEQGKILAEYILSEVGKIQHLNHSFAIPRQNIYVLRNTKIPTVMVEIGFITNPEDKAKMLTEEFRQAMAEAIGTGILKYFTDDSQHGASEGMEEMEDAPQSAPSTTPRDERDEPVPREPEVTWRTA